MEEKVLKLMAYFALLFVAVWIIASAMGKRSQMSEKRHQRAPQANGNVWQPGGKSVPAASSQTVAAGVFPGMVPI